jgi:Concanavalin A-like lectin/glucanases superfamily/NedA-like, galactose-binding domain
LPVVGSACRAADARKEPALSSHRYTEIAYRLARRPLSATWAMGRRMLLGPVAVSLVIAVSLVPGAGAVRASSLPGDPSGIDPGTPTYTGSANPVPPEGVAFDPSKNMLQAIYNHDQAAGGTSYWVDRMLGRPFLNNSDSALFTRGRALYMYTHRPGTLGFSGGYAYRERPTRFSQDLYTITIPSVTLTEDTTQRMNYPSYFTSVYNAAGLSIREKKFITYNNVAVTDLTITNTGGSASTTTLNANSPVATTPSPDGTELSGTVTARYALTTIFPRFSGDGFTVSGTGLTRSVTLDPGASASLKLQLGMITNELPDSATEYQRYKAYDPDTAWLTQMSEYNKFWVDNVPYVDIPDLNIKKLSYYRTWENRFNLFDGNIPGNDYQFPADMEGVLGYNNQISLTVPMRLNDLMYWRDPVYSDGPVLSQGEESGCQAFHDNPGNTGNWNNTYEQYTAQEAWQNYMLHGGPPSIVKNLAKYSECDVKGTLAKFDTNHNNLIEYSSGTLPGNDADSVAFAFYGLRPQDRTETSFWYAGAKAAAAEYTLIGDSAKAAEMNTIADNIKTAIMNTLWADGPVDNGTIGGQAIGPRVPGKLGNAVKLNGGGDYVKLPAGIVSGLNDFTVSAWVNPAAIPTWSRVFDFGTGTGTYMFLTVNAGAGPRFAITTGGAGGEQQISTTQQLPVGQWTHLAVTLSGNTGTLYVNGTPVATNTNMTLRPSSLGATGNNWIGKSQYGDPNLNATVDDFAIYSRALSAPEIQALAGGQQAAGDVADYRFDEDSGAAALDSSGNGRDATIVSPSATNACPGKVFLQRDLQTGNLVCWKDQQNFAPFINGIPPNTDNYKQALRYYADPSEFPIMPSYTADQADKAAATAFGNPGTNNFSNINATLQAQLFAKAIRDYPSQYITPLMYLRLIQWLTWNEYINGDNRYPDNNEYYFNWNPVTQTLGRSSINHDTLGSYNRMIFEDVAGLRARLDNVVELWPIDMGYDHFAVNNMSYHGSDVTIVWQKPGGTTYYPLAPMGYSLYVDGQRAFTVSDLAHVTWNSQTGAVSVLDGSAAQVGYSTGVPLKAADQVSLSGNARLVDEFQKAGVNLTPASSAAGTGVNLAQGKTASASYTTTSPPSQATDPANAVDGFTISGLPVVSGSYVGTNPIWGDVGSPNTQDWLAVDLGAPTTFNNVKLYFYSNKQFGSGGNTYRQPAAFTVQYFNGTDWVDLPRQLHSPGTPQPNYNEVYSAPVTAQKVRVLMTRQSGYGVGLKEVQVYNTTPLAMGFWRNRNGQAIISGGSSADGACNSAVFLRQYNPFKDLSPDATCGQVAAYVSATLSAGTDCAASACNAMLKAQMLGAALGEFFNDPALADADVDLTRVCADIGTCATLENDSGAFGGASHLTVAEALAYASGQSNTGGTAWYGNVKATQVMAKDVFDAISNQEAASP